MVDTENWEYKLLKAFVNSQPRCSSAVCLEEAFKLLDRNSTHKYVHCPLQNVQKFIQEYPGTYTAVLNTINSNIVLYKVGPYFLNRSFCCKCSTLVEIPSSDRILNKEASINHECERTELECGNKVRVILNLAMFYFSYLS